MTRAFSDYLASSLAQIGRDVPSVYAHIVRALGGRVIAIEVGGETVSVRETKGRLEVGGRGEAEVRAITSRGAIVALVDGRVTLEEAVLRGAVDLFGDVADLLAGLDALVGYVNGAARCPELLGLMDEFRRDAGEGGYG